MGIRLTKSDVIWSYLGSFVSLGGSVLTLFLVLGFLDDDQSSLWYIFSSIGAMSVLFDFGFSVTFARNITYCWSGASELLAEDVAEQKGDHPNYILMKRVITTCKMIYLIISGMVLFGCMTIGTYYVRWVARDVPGEISLVSWFVYATALFLNIYYGYYSSFLRGVGAVDKVNRNTVISKLIQLSLMLVFLIAGFGLIGACAAYLSYGFLFRFLCKRDFYNYQGIGGNLVKVNEKTSIAERVVLLKTVWHNAWREGLISLSSYVCTQAGTIVSSAFFPLVQAGAYSLALQIANMVATVSGTLYVAYEPSLQAAEISRDKIRVRNIMGTIVAMTTILFVILTIGVTVFAPVFIHLIKPSYMLSPALLLVLCLYQYILKIRDCYATYFSCSNRVPYVWSYCLTSFVGLGLSALALSAFDGGVYAFVLAQMAPQLAWNGWIWSLRARREMGITLIGLYRAGVKGMAEKLIKR